MDFKFNFDFSFIKKYSALLLPVGLILVAVLLFIPTKMISSSVSKSLDESARTESQIRSLKRNAVSKDQWEIEAAYQQAHKEDVNSIEELLKQTTQRELLSYSIFPEPTTRSNFIFTNFGQSYVKALEELANEVMQAGDAPTDQFLNTLTQSVKGNLRSGDTREDSAAERIINTACLEKANQIPVYANPKTSFVGYDFWDDYRFVSESRGIEDCWYAQVGYWIMEDAAKSISEINAGSSNVFESKVKRLLGVRFSRSTGSTSRGGGSSFGSVNERPAYVLPDGSGALAPAWTGRKTNQELDVVHFRLTVIIGADAIPEFYTVLCGGKEHKFMGWSGQEPEQRFVHNQITILEEKVNTIDRSSAEHKNYRYGTGAVVELDLICEYVFQKDGYEEIKPEMIKAALEPEQGNRNRRR